jgi:hypothetical protein
MAIEIALRALEDGREPLERIIGLFAASLAAPALRRSNDERGFRYEAPDTRHFCLLKAVRALSAFNASIELARKGYGQEIAVLMRTLIECTTHIEFVLETNESAGHRALVRKYIGDFFADDQRSPTGEIRKAQVQQGKVHETLGKSLDKIAEELGEMDGRTPAERLFSNSYRIFSNYVHAKYPECMDLYGGGPGRYHLHGMSGTPKDGENLAILQTFVVTLENCFVRMIQGLELRHFIEADPVIGAWYKRALERRWQAQAKSR